MHLGVKIKKLFQNKFHFNNSNYLILLDLDPLGFYVGHVKNSEDTKIELLIHAYEPQVSEMSSLDVHNVTPVLPLQCEYFLCSICNRRLDQCKHAIGDNYDGQTCKAIPEGYEKIGIRMNECTPLKYRVTDMVVFKNEGESSKTIWYGYPSEVERLHRIDLMGEEGNISKPASVQFKQFFTENITGISEFGQ